MVDVDERLITGETIVRTTSKHWIAPLGDSKWAILMIVGALIAAWLQGDSTTGVTGFFNRGLELVRLALFLGRSPGSSTTSSRGGRPSTTSRTGACSGPMGSFDDGKRTRCSPRSPT